MKTALSVIIILMYKGKDWGEFFASKASMVLKLASSRCRVLANFRLQLCKVNAKGEAKISDGNFERACFSRCSFNSLSPLLNFDEKSKDYVNSKHLKNGRSGSDTPDRY